MLILSRKKHEGLVINGNIVITVLSVINGRVRLGVEAPIEIPVHRREVFDAIELDRNKPTTL